MCEHVDTPSHTYGHGSALYPDHLNRRVIQIIVDDVMVYIIAAVLVGTAPEPLRLARASTDGAGEVAGDRASPCRYRRRTS